MSDTELEQMTEAERAMMEQWGADGDAGAAQADATPSFDGGFDEDDDGGARILNRYAHGMVAVHNLTKLQDLTQAMARLLRQ